MGWFCLIVGESRANCVVHTSGGREREVNREVGNVASYKLDSLLDYCTWPFIGQ